MRAPLPFQFATLMTSALSTGVFFGTRSALGPSRGSFSPATYVEVQQATIRNLRPVMGPLLPAAVAANAVSAVLAYRSRGAFKLTLAALLSQLTSLALTVAVELPINGRVMKWSAMSPPPDWKTTRDRWGTVHSWRTATAVFGLGCLVAATLEG